MEVVPRRVLCRLLVPAALCHSAKSTCSAAQVTSNGDHAERDACNLGHTGKCKRLNSSMEGHPTVSSQLFTLFLYRRPQILLPVPACLQFTGTRPSRQASRRQPKPWARLGSPSFLYQNVQETRKAESDVILPDMEKTALLEKEPLR